MSAARRSTPPEMVAIDEDDLDGPRSETRPLLPLYAIPSLAIGLEGLRFLPLDARMAYVLSLVDGQYNVEMLLDISSRELPRDEMLAILARLLQLGAIELRDP